MTQERSCVSCRAKRNQNELLRVAKIKDDFIIDQTQKLGGRGAYICKNKDCINNTIKKHLLNRAFKMNVNCEIYKKLEEYGENI